MNNEVYVNALVSKAGGTASKNSYMVRVPIPKDWANIMKIDSNNKSLKLRFDGNKITIEKNIENE